MLSIIICSKNPDVSPELRQNIAETIGCEHELVVIDNSHNRYSIFQAYNEGVSRAKGDILCFMHDDILYRSTCWGNIVQEVFHDSSIGVIGFAGAHFLSSSPWYWSYSPFISEHNLCNDHGKVLEFFKDDYYDENGLADLVVVDGFCFFVRSSLFDKIRFDEDTYTGFHAYDMDLCMQVLGLGLRVCACNKVLIEHFWSEADSTSKKGYELLDRNMTLFTNKFKNSLPIHRGVQGIPDAVWEKLDSLMKNSYDLKMVRRGKRYRLGKAILSPFNIFRS